VIQKGDTVIVTADGRYHGQEVQVQRVDSPKTSKRVWYLLAVQWGGIPRPSWFEDQEVEKIEPQEQDEGREQVL
jgi:hypothetical protein